MRALTATVPTTAHRLTPTEFRLLVAVWRLCTDPPETERRVWVQRTDKTRLRHMLKFKRLGYVDENTEVVGASRLFRISDLGERRLLDPASLV